MTVLATLVHVLATQVCVLARVALMQVLAPIVYRCAGIVLAAVVLATPVPMSDAARRASRPLVIVIVLFPTQQAIADGERKRADPAADGPLLLRRR